MQQIDSTQFYDQDAVVFSACDPNVIEIFKNRYPYILTQVIFDEPPKGVYHGRLWCFVTHGIDDKSGLSLCLKLRNASNTIHSHITILLTKSDEYLRQAAMEAGADDYIVGSLSIEHILERVQFDNENVRLESGRLTQLKHGNLSIDLNAYRVHYNDRKIFLPLNEFRLLAHFMENPDKLLTRPYLIEVIGKNNHAIDERTVDVWIGRLRRILARNNVPDPLRTVRSMGYVFDSI